MSHISWNPILTIAIYIVLYQIFFNKKMTNLAKIDCWIFDLDNTLYPASVNLFSQINVKMSDYIMTLLDVDKLTADKMRAVYWEKYGTSLAGLMQNHQIDPEDFLNVVHDIDFSVLSKDLNLSNSLNKLPGRKLVYTNGTAPYAREVLKYRGLTDVFDEIYGIEDAAYVPKPFPEAFEIVFSKYLSLGAKITTGKPSSIKAKGPCFISPAGYPSA